MQGDDYLYFIDRSLKKSSRLKTQQSVHFEIIKLGPQGCNQLLLRDDYALKIINPVSQKIKEIRDAPFYAQEKKIYKTVDIRPVKDKGIEIIYLQSEQDDIPQSTSI